MKKLVLLALVFSPMFAQADVLCKSMQTGEIVTITTEDSEGSPLVGTVQVTRLGNVLVDVPVSQVVAYTNTEDEIALQALDAEMKHGVLRLEVKKDAGPLFPKPRKGVYWGTMNHTGATVGLRCELN